MGMGNEAEDISTALWPGLDCAINCNIPLENVFRAFPEHPSHGLSDLSLILPHRSKDPGAGAVTTYRAAKTYVKRYIPPGGELFKFYGDKWFLTRVEDFAGFDRLPLKDDFKRIQKLLKTCEDRFDNGCSDLVLSAMHQVRDSWEISRTLNALPNTPEELKVALETDISNVHQPNSTRTIEWLQQHGKCIDHIIHRKSTIPGAGEGAFAKRRLPTGTLITGSPVLVVPHEKLFYMFDFEPKKKKKEKDSDDSDDSSDDEDDSDDSDDYDDDDDAFADVEYIKSSLKTKQVVYNYCLGHKDSNMLLFPYGSGIHFINHGDDSKANVRMQWAKHGTSGHNESWLEKSPEDFEFVFATNLGIDYIATRDIEEGEELFLNYGPEWEAAWNTHVASWKKSKIRTSAVDWNTKEKYYNQPIRTEKEQKKKPYPASIEPRCHVHLVYSDWETQNLGWGRLGPFENEDKYVYIYGLQCSILDRSSDGKYVVDLFIDEKTYIPLPHDWTLNHVRRNVPREAIFFLDASYESDLYLDNAFRQPIGIPDYMMPEAWKTKVHPNESTDGKKDEL